MNTVEEHTEISSIINMLLEHYYKEWIWLVSLWLLLGQALGIFFRKLTYFSETPS